MNSVCPSCYLACKEAAVSFRHFADFERNDQNRDRRLIFQAWNNVLYELHKSKDCRCMARPKAKQGTDWKGFANVPFNAEARMLYEATEIKDEAVYQRLEDLIATGYRVTFSYDRTNDTYQTSITCAAAKDPNDGFTLTSRGPTWWDSLKVATFKHYDLTAGVWPHGEATSGDKWG